MTEMGSYGDSTFTHFSHLCPGQCWLARKETRNLARMPSAAPLEGRSGDIKDCLKAIIAENWIRVFVYASVPIVEGYRASKGHGRIVISAACYPVQPNHPGVGFQISHLSLEVLRAYSVRC